MFNYERVFIWEQETRIVIESDDETDTGFSCLLKEKGTGNISVTFPKTN